MCASLLFQLEAFCASAVTVSTCSVPIVNFIEFDASPFTGVEYVLTTGDTGFDVESLFDELVTSVENNPLGLVTNRRVWASSIVLEDCKSSFEQQVVVYDSHVVKKKSFTDDTVMHLNCRQQCVLHAGHLS